jgi:hypothetical protein
MARARRVGGGGTGGGLNHAISEQLKILRLLEYQLQATELY